MPFRKPPITKLSDKFLGFCAVTPNKAFMELFERADVKNVLVSYHYIRQNPIMTKDMMQQVRDHGGLFMTDSGAFSFLTDKKFNAQKFDWDSYVEDYAEWLDDNKEFVFSACNLDVDLYVGADRVRRWNEIYFDVLNKHINCIYVAHQNVFGRGKLDALNEYCKDYDYVAVNDGLKDEVSAVYAKAKVTKTNIHGLAWTKPTLLDDNPFFSVDSSSWVNYQKYGSTPVFDGTNFKQYDNNDKAIRSTLKNKCSHYGVKYYEFCNEKDHETGEHNDKEGLTFSLRTWLDVFQHIKKFARTKLTTTLEDRLQGKATVFHEDPSGSLPTTAPASNPPSLISGALSSLGVSATPAIPISYGQDEDGDEVAMYEKRPKGKVAIAEFIKTKGDMMVCNTCHIADKCPIFKEDNECGFDFGSQDLVSDPLTAINYMIHIQTERVNRAMVIEKMEGGNINKVYSQELKILENLNLSRMNILTIIQNKGVNVSKVVVEHTTDKTSQEDSQPGFKEMMMAMMNQNKP